MNSGSLSSDVGSVFGPLTIGIIIAVFLTGISTLQVWNYFRDFPNDRILVKCFVGIVFAIDAVHTFILVWIDYCISMPDGSLLETVMPAYPAVLCVDVVISFIVQVFYCMRVYHLSRSMTVALPCCLMVIARLVISESLVAEIFANNGAGLLVKLDIPVDVRFIATAALGTASDMILAVCLCVIIIKMRPLGTESSTKMIDKLITFVVGSGLLTSVLAFVVLCSYLTMNNLVYVAVNFVNTKVYVNAFLALLNERSHFRVAMRRAETSVTGLASTHLSFQHDAVLTVRLGPSENIARPESSAAAAASVEKVCL